MDIGHIVKEQRVTWKTNVTKDIHFRRAQLLKLKALLENHEREIYQALQEDLNKSSHEAYLTEYSVVMEEINLALKCLKKWSTPAKKRTNISTFPSTGEVVKEPYGVVLILSPWNYPLQLALSPAVGALAAGNCVILKTSRSSKSISTLLEQLICEYFPKSIFTCLPANSSYEEVLKQEYDFIFFTGSKKVGKTVMHAAAEHVTPIVLELGGKSPCLIDSKSSIPLAAKRIAWGKLINSGQTCVAPDYVLIDKKCKSSFIKEYLRCIQEMYKEPLNNPEYPKIISKGHFDRLTALIQEEEHVLGGEVNEEQQKIAPAIFYSATYNSHIMEEEIFGPLLPIIEYQSLDEAIDYIKNNPKPLACYIFSKDSSYYRKVINQVSFGGGCVNDVIVHLINENLPFGGVGGSGLGNYHGKYSFDTFSHSKSILHSKTFLDVPVRYPPYSPLKKKFTHLLLRK